MKSISASLLASRLAIISLIFLISSPAFASGIEPPWSHSMVSGVNVTVPTIDNAPDLHGDVTNPQLVIFFAGNQYMLVNRLLQSFQKTHPEYKRVFAATLPPGLLAQAVRDGGFVIGNMRVGLKPDIFTAGHGGIQKLQKRDHWFSSQSDYASNRLAIMTASGNPKHIHNWQDLANPHIKICMPNPKWEGIASHAIVPALRKTGGSKLVDAIYQEKVKSGMTFLTRIHHRQTPIRIMEHKCAAGAVWYTEAYFHEHIAHHPTSLVQIPSSQNHVVTYTAAIMRSAPHPKAAKAFMKFLTGPKGQAIYKHYGFMPPR